MPRRTRRSIQPFQLQVGDIFIRQPARRPWRPGMTCRSGTSYEPREDSPAARLDTGERYLVLHREDQRIEGEYSRAHFVCARLRRDGTTERLTENFLMRAYDVYFFGGKPPKDIPMRVIKRAKRLFILLV